MCNIHYIWLILHIGKKEGNNLWKNLNHFFYF